MNGASKLGLGVSLLFGGTASVMSNQVLNVEFPLMVTISKNQQAAGLMIRADKNHYTAVYRNGTFSDLNISFDVVQNDSNIHLYQMTVTELFHQCAGKSLAVVTTIDTIDVDKGDVLMGFSFPFNTDGQNYNRHNAMMVFPPITAGGAEKACHGVFSVSVHEQI